MHLSKFLGADGLVELLATFEDNPDMDQLIELIQRLHVPGYEEARRYASAALSAGVFESNLPKKFYTQANIERILQFGRGVV
jgi:hypothetical protein